MVVRAMIPISVPIVPVYHDSKELLQPSLSLYMLTIQNIRVAALKMTFVVYMHARRSQVRPQVRHIVSLSNVSMDTSCWNLLARNEGDCCGCMLTGSPSLSPFFDSRAIVLLFYFLFLFFNQWGQRTHSCRSQDCHHHTPYLTHYWLCRPVYTCQSGATGPLELSIPCLT